MSSGRRPGRRRWHGRVRPSAPGPEVHAGGTRPNPDTVAYPGVTRSTAVMATGTTLSRVTGVIRQMALAYAVGAFALADAYNLANTIPNILVDIVIGGVLAATFVPVFVERLTTRDEHEAWEAISAVVSVSLVVIAVERVTPG